MEYESIERLELKRRQIEFTLRSQEAELRVHNAERKRQFDCYQDNVRAFRLIKERLLSLKQEKVEPQTKIEHASELRKRLIVSRGKTADAKDKLSAAEQRAETSRLCLAQQHLRGEIISEAISKLHAAHSQGRELAEGERQQEIFVTRQIREIEEKVTADNSAQRDSNEIENPNESPGPILDLTSSVLSEGQKMDAASGSRSERGIDQSASDQKGFSRCQDEQPRSRDERADEASQSLRRFEQGIEELDSWNVGGEAALQVTYRAGNGERYQVLVRGSKSSGVSVQITSIGILSRFSALNARHEVKAALEKQGLTVTTISVLNGPSAAGGKTI